MVPHLVLENVKAFKEQRKVRFLNSQSNLSIKINKEYNMIGSHNTFSYLPIKNRWRKIFKPWYKCQDKDIIQQIDNGARFFDIRVKFDKKGLLNIVHNKVVFDINEIQFWRLMVDVKNLAKELNTKLYFRVILDIRKEPKDKKHQLKFFKSFIYQFNKFDERICLDHSIIYWNWDYTYYYNNQFNIIEDHASVKAKWYEYILGTKYYATKVGYKYINEHSSKNIYLLDFI